MTMHPSLNGITRVLVAMAVVVAMSLAVAAAPAKTLSEVIDALALILDKSATRIPMLPGSVSGVEAAFKRIGKAGGVRYDAQRKAYRLPGLIIPKEHVESARILTVNIGKPRFVVALGRGDAAYNSVRAAAGESSAPLLPSLSETFANVRYQAVTWVGHLDAGGKHLSLKEADGTIRSFALEDVTKAAAENDVVLTFLSCKAGLCGVDGPAVDLWAPQIVAGIRSGKEADTYGGLVGAFGTDDAPFVLGGVERNERASTIALTAQRAGHTLQILIIVPVTMPADGPGLPWEKSPT